MTKQDKKIVGLFTEPVSRAARSKARDGYGMAISLRPKRRNPHNQPPT
jgi:hypothetical protein